ncbi:MAG: flagellar assembly protein FliW [Clostridia bacterium]|nr:flagellar assembly protein FliW [Clostridia bacterium]
MQLDTVHFGAITVQESDFIYFPEGIPGFEDSKKFVLIGKDTNETPFFWLQSIDKPELCFVVTDPFLIYNDYTVDINDEDVELLKISNPENVLTIAIVVIPEDIKKTRVNLKAPVLINIDEKLGKQVVQKNETLPIRYYLYQE